MLLTSKSMNISWYIVVTGLIFSCAVYIMSRELIEGTEPVSLRCEYMTNPLGIDVVQPRLSWKLASDKRSVTQKAYRVLVATSAKNLAEDIGDLWDSGKVETGNSTCILYDGKNLTSRQRCYWKVRIWDQDGKKSSWSEMPDRVSEPAIWSMGLIKKSDWKARWIGYDRARADAEQKLSAGKEEEKPSVPDFRGASWIWFAREKGNPKKNMPACKRYFRVMIDLPKDIRIKSATALVTVDDQYTLFLNNKQVRKSDNKKDAWKRVKPINIAKRLRPGRNIIAIEAVNLSDSPAGLLADIVVITKKKDMIRLTSGSGWKCSDKAGDKWTAVEFDDSSWPAAKVIGKYGIAPWRKVRIGRKNKGKKLLLFPPVLLQKRFQLDRTVKRATLYASALGIYEMRLNGKRVGEDYFTPGWTDYNKRVYYNTYDVTGMVKKGGNTITGILADGWYSGYLGWKRLRDHYGKNPRLLAQMIVEYTDGTQKLVATDFSWKASTGPILESDFLMGEMYDARIEPGNWNAVDVTESLPIRVQAYPGVTVKKFREIKPVKITEPKKGVYVLDMGSNFAGFVRLKIKGKAGTRVVLRFAERLKPDGMVYTDNLRGARATDTYICRGSDGFEVFEPRFTFHGFQYVEVTGYPGDLPEDAITGIELTSATPAAGSFECSDRMLNQLYYNINQTQRANFIDIPTDCPQRDERLGWTGDAQVYIRTATCNMDVQAFFTKWLVDLRDAQLPDGQFPKVAPMKVAGGGGGPAWADAGVICPWTIYEVYDDRRILEDNYDAMKKFIEFRLKQTGEDLLPPKKFHCYGDWLSIGAKTPKPVIHTAYFACSVRLTARTAEVLGKTDEARKYRKLYNDIKEAFNRAYVADDGRINGDTQCSYVLALANDLVDGEKRKKAEEYLVEKIKKRDWHLSTGFIGTKDLMLTLTKIGRTDVAYRLLHNDTFPSWGFSIKHGATSIWERWDGWTPEKGFQKPGMNSFAHYSFGAVYQWMFENIGGIHSDGPGYRKIIIRPRPGGKLTWAKVSYESNYGRIVTAWKIEDGLFKLDVTVPPNTSAKIYLPGGTKQSAKDGAKFLETADGCAIFAVGSGKYRFISKWQG